MSMKMMTVQGSPVVRYMTAAAAIVIVVFGLKYASDFVAPIFFATTLAILFSPTLRWLEKKGLHAGLALLVMVLGLGGLIVLMVIIVVGSLQHLSLQLPVYEELLLQRISDFTAALGNIGIDVQAALDSFVVDTTAFARSAIDALLWSWVFGFLGALIAIPATLLVKTLLQGRQETHFLVVLLSGEGENDVTVTIPQGREDGSNTGEEQSDIQDAGHEALMLDSTEEASAHEE
jgi:predicted PurR-regulated permease PerM